MIDSEKVHAAVSHWLEGLLEDFESREPLHTLDDVGENEYQAYVEYDTREGADNNIGDLGNEDNRITVFDHDSEFHAGTVLRRITVDGGVVVAEVRFEVSGEDGYDACLNIKGYGFDGAGAEANAKKFFKRKVTELRSANVYHYIRMLGRMVRQLDAEDMAAHRIELDDLRRAGRAIASRRPLPPEPLPGWADTPLVDPEAISAVVRAEAALSALSPELLRQAAEEVSHDDRMDAIVRIAPPPLEFNRIAPTMVPAWPFRSDVHPGPDPARPRTIDTNIRDL
jgi:hypothetical protein